MSFPRNNVGSCTTPSNKNKNNNIQDQQAENMGERKKIRTRSADFIGNESYQ